ncbi:alpha-2,8-sialyltransferase 8E isoform X2 [Panthera uncia]|uniref:alpha-2,8-sialyltransferase 8E isoform X2 n=1 Tax=Panthera uncia TaxID=29064 RepID=UPI0020FF8383|nr:alpha-2,8-sialyltransferase 8E isoform X2 [Panthera uncia]
MRYADPSANRDLLGNRTLLFIFICAFALVTLLQQILYGRNYIKRYFEFYEGPFEYNSTRCLELRHEILEVKVLSMVKQSELFDRWKSLQMCRWAMNISEANQFKSTLSRCCNAPSFLFTTQKNTPLGTKLKYEVDTSGIYHINQEIFRMFPKVLLGAGQSGQGKGATSRGPLWPRPRSVASLCCALCTHCPGSGWLSGLSSGAPVWAQ